MDCAVCTAVLQTVCIVPARGVFTGFLHCARAQCFSYSNGNPVQVQETSQKRLLHAFYTNTAYTNASYMSHTRLIHIRSMC